MVQQLSFKRKHRGVVLIHGPWSLVSKTSRLKLKRKVSRTKKKSFKIAIMFLGRRRRSREESPEWICASRCRQVSVPLIHVFAGFFALKPFYDYSLCSVCILPQVRSLQSAVCVLH